MDINKPFVWYLVRAKADHTNCLSLFTGDNSSWYFQPDNSWQDKSRFRRNWLQPGTGNNLHNQSWSARGASVVFSDRTWCFVKPCGLFLVDIPVDDRLTSITLELVSLGEGYNDWLWWPSVVDIFGFGTFSAARQGKADHASSCLCFQSLFQGGLGWEPTVDHPHGCLNATMIPGVSMNLPGGGAQGGIWQVPRHPYLVRKGL